MVKVTLGEYLQKMKRVHGDAPSLRGIARGIGTTSVSISRIANNHMKMLNVETLAAIIQYLRDYGFDTQVSDILVFQEN